MSQRVAILGGGVGGLTAAHELVERGFDVTVYEKRPVVGGKARSIPVPGTGVGGRPELPGEHGFRFFPAFYRHLPDTMARIPYQGGTVADNLVAATRILLARAAAPGVILPSRSPKTPDDLVTAIRALFTGIGVSDLEVLYFVDRLLVLLTSCPERREKEYEYQTWWDFIDAQNHSRNFQVLLGQGLTRSLVAMRAESSSTRSVGYILLQLLYGIFAATGFDRLLDGPTNDVWITPWLRYLEGKGVRFVNGWTIREIQASPAGVTTVIADVAGLPQPIAADYYVAALPVEIMRTLVTPALAQLAPSLANLPMLQLNWMNGIQFFLQTDVPICPGHVSFADSQWALTAISQKQFWRAPLSDFGDGTTGGILSVDISDWDAAGIRFGKTAKQCTPDEIRDEVLAQIKVHLNTGAAPVIDDANLQRYFLDPDIEFPNPGAMVNAEPLLINTAGSLQYRPEAITELPNLFLASDYVRTFTDLACMESANEAARRAVNGILDRCGLTATPVGIWPLWEPEFFQPMIELDRIRYSMGLPHMAKG